MRCRSTLSQCLPTCANAATTKGGVSPATARPGSLLPDAATTSVDEHTAKCRPKLNFNFVTILLCRQHTLGHQPHSQHCVTSHSATTATPNSVLVSFTKVFRVLPACAPKPTFDLRRTPWPCHPDAPHRAAACSACAAADCARRRAAPPRCVTVTKQKGSCPAPVNLGQSSEFKPAHLTRAQFANSRVLISNASRSILNLV